MSKEENIEVQRLVVFKSQSIRRILHQSEWYFSVVDIVRILTSSLDAGAYWRKLKQRLSEESGEPVTFCHGFKLLAADGKMRETDCANVESLFRIIQTAWIIVKGDRCRPQVAI